MLDGRVNPVPKSTGILLPGLEARIVRDDGSEAAIHEPGNLYLKGGCVAMGYWKNPEANEESFVDGWLNTGDRFMVDEHGNFLSVFFFPLLPLSRFDTPPSFDDRTKVSPKLPLITSSLTRFYSPRTP